MPRTLRTEEVLEACFADLLKGLVFDDEVMDWIIDALHQSHADEKRLDVMRLLVYRTNKGNYRTDLISSTMIALTIYRTRLL
jgi:hypothetical protein